MPALYKQPLKSILSFIFIRTLIWFLIKRKWISIISYRGRRLLRMRVRLFAFFFIFPCRRHSLNTNLLICFSTVLWLSTNYTYYTNTRWSSVAILARFAKHTLPNIIQYLSFYWFCCCLLLMICFIFINIVAIMK